MNLAPITVPHIIAAASATAGVFHVIDPSPTRDQCLVASAAQILTHQPQLLTKTLIDRFGESDDDPLQPLANSFFREIEALPSTTDGRLSAFGQSLTAILSSLETLEPKPGTAAELVHRVAELSPPGFFPPRTKSTDAKARIVAKRWNAVGLAGAQIVYGSQSFSPHASRLAYVLKLVRRFQAIMQNKALPLTAKQQEMMPLDAVSDDPLRRLHAALCTFDQGGESAVRNELLQLPMHTGLSRYITHMLHGRTSRRILLEIQAPEHPFAEFVLRRQMQQQANREIFLEVLEQFRSEGDKNVKAIPPSKQKTFLSHLKEVSDADRPLVLSILAGQISVDANPETQSAVEEFLDSKQATDDPAHRQAVHIKLAKAYSTKNNDAKATSHAAQALAIPVGSAINSLWTLLTQTGSEQLFQAAYRRLHTRPGDGPELPAQFHASLDVVNQRLWPLYLQLGQAQAEALHKREMYDLAAELFEKLAVFAAAIGNIEVEKKYLDRILGANLDDQKWGKALEITRKLRSFQEIEITAEPALDFAREQLSIREQLYYVDTSDEPEEEDNLVSLRTLRMALTRLRPSQTRFSMSQLSKFMALHTLLGDPTTALQYVDEMIRLSDEAMMTVIAHPPASSEDESDSPLEGVINTFYQHNAYADLERLLELLLESSSQ
ncbi:MAG: hypothetical protein HY540_06465 [Deltaproteobacteria bacterium]|nr:hypothetical protein [Deltaproteobacteria bacterium]